MRTATASRTTPVRRPTIRINWTRLGVLVLGAILMSAALTLLAFRITRDGALPGVELRGADPSRSLDGLEAAALETVVEDHARAVAGRTLVVRNGPLQLSASAPDLGYAIDVDQTVEALLSRGRQTNPFPALRDQLFGGVTTLPVQPIARLDTDTFEGWVVNVATELAIQPALGEVRVTGGQVSIELPPASRTVDADALRALAVQAIAVDDSSVIDVPTTSTRPELTEDTRLVIQSQAVRAISAPVTLTRDTLQWTVEPNVIADLLGVRAVPVSDDNTADVELTIDPLGLAELLPVPAQSLQTPPSGATFDVSSGTPRLVPGRDGFAFDIFVAADQVLRLATSDGPRSAPLQGRVIPPEVTTEQVGRLGIRREVATFTTEHACCEGRVSNIRRIAELVDGTIVRPGETFSLNDAAGPRTPSRGFVDGGAIESGEFVDQIGGGVSQFTTTLFNAVFFAGYEIVEFKPHSYYITRYPVGREATLNFDPPIDLAFTNNSPHGILIKTSHTETSITITLYSTIFAAVESTLGERYDIRPFDEERRPTDELPSGEERLVQQGRDGFTIDFTREITYVDGRGETEEYTTVYRAQPTIIEVGRGTAEAEDTPDQQDDTDPDAPPIETSPPATTSGSTAPSRPDPTGAPEPTTTRRPATARPTSSPQAPPPPPEPVAPETPDPQPTEQSPEPTRTNPPSGSSTPAPVGPPD